MDIHATATHYRKLFHCLFFVFLVAVFCYYVANIHLLYVPDSDFFLYIDEGRKLLSNPFSRVVAPPIFSVIVYLFEVLLPIKYPGIIGGTVFNIFCFVASLWFLWRLSKRWMGWFGLLPIVLLTINPLSFVVNLQPLNEPLGVLMVVMALYYGESNPALSVVLALLAFFSRPESVGILVIFLVQDLFITKRKPRLIWLIASFCVVALWYFRPILTVQKGDYLAEIMTRRNEIPNTAFLRNSFSIAPFLTFSIASVNDAFNPLRLSSDTTVITALSLIWIICGTIYFCKKRLILPLTVFSYVVLYSLIHVVFPDRVLRYSYPTTPYVYMLFFWPAVVINGRAPRAQKVAAAGIIFVLTLIMVTSMILNRSAYIESQRWMKAEKRLVAQWLNEHVQKPTKVYAYEYWISKYYTDNINVSYADTVNPHSWVYDLCRPTEDIYMVVDSTTQQTGFYLDYLDGWDYFVRTTKSAAATSHLTLIKTISVADRWAKIYSVAKTTDNWCSVFAK